MKNRNSTITAGLITVIIVLGLFVPVPTLHGENPGNRGDDGVDWILKKEENGVRVYSGAVRDTDALVFKADTTITAPFDAMLALMIDINNYITWIGGCKKSAVLKKVSETEYIGHVIMDAGVIFNDRDFVLHAKAFQDPESKRVHVNYKSLTGYLPKLRRTVRMTVNEGFWIVEPLDRNTVGLTWQGRLDPGGWFPTWLLKMLFDTVVFKTFRDITSEVTQGKYRDFKFQGFRIKTAGSAGIPSRPGEHSVEDKVPVSAR